LTARENPSPGWAILHEMAWWAILGNMIFCCLFIMDVNELLKHLLTAQQPEQKHEIYINNL
jgi:hypothetical protein